NRLLGPARVLIVVDQPLANLVALTLNHGKYVTRIAKDAVSARSSLEAWQPHLLLVDLDADDPESLRLIGQRIGRQRIPSIALSRRCRTSSRRIPARRLDATGSWTRSGVRTMSPGAMSSIATSATYG